MRVRELIEQLSKFDPELIVYKQKDDEGNGYHALYAVDDDAFILTEDLTGYDPDVFREDDMEYLEYEREDCTQVLVVV